MKQTRREKLELKAAMMEANEVRRAARILGRVASVAKAAAARENGRLGGRPRKRQD